VDREIDTETQNKTKPHPLPMACFSTVHFLRRRHNFTFSTTKVLMRDILSLHPRKKTVDLIMLIQQKDFAHTEQRTLNY